MGNSSHHIADTFLDALGNNDFPFTGQQLNGAHFTHVHAYRVSCAAGVRFDGGQCSRGFGSGGLVGRGVAFSPEQRISVGCFLADLDAHVINHADYVFYLIRIRDILRQVVVDLGVSQVTLLFSSGNEVFQTGFLRIA